MMCTLIRRALSDCNIRHGLDALRSWLEPRDGAEQSDLASRSLEHPVTAVSIPGMRTLLETSLKRSPPTQTPSARVPPPRRLPRPPPFAQALLVLRVASMAASVAAAKARQQPASARQHPASAWQQPAPAWQQPASAWQPRPRWRGRPSAPAHLAGLPLWSALCQSS